MAFSLAASAVSLALSVAVSAKVLDGVSPTRGQNTALHWIHPGFRAKAANTSNYYYNQFSRFMKKATVTLF